MTHTLLKDLARAKVMIQQRSILSAMGVMQRDLVEPEVEQCPTCGDYDCNGGLPCESGDGV